MSLATRSSARSPVSIDELVALGDEMAALVRCGVPLERGLVNLGEDVPGRLGKLARQMAERLERGEPLEEVLLAEDASLPRVYRSVVAAGLRTGQLPAALAGLAGSARKVAELRRGLGLAFVYPLLVLLLSYGLFVLFVIRVAPQLLAAYDGLRVARPAFLEVLVELGRSASTWGPIVPLVVLVVAAVWWWQSGRAMLIGPSWASRFLGWIPWVGSTLASCRAAMFADVFALLVEHDVPLDEAVRLAAEASGDRQMLAAGERMADEIRRGGKAAEACGGLPPLLTWLLSQTPDQTTLVAAARHAAEGYRWRAAHHAEMARTVVPVLWLVVLGGSVTLFYALTLFLPWSNLLRSIPF